MKQHRNFSRSRRSSSPQEKIKKTQKGRQKKNRNSNNSSCKTNSQSHEKQPRQVHEGKLLNFIKELEAQQEKQVSSLKLSQSFIEDVQQKLTIEEDQSHQEFDKQLQYKICYEQEFHQTLINENIYLGNSLQNQKIDDKLRAKMIDWMIEVLGNYNETTSNATFFRSVSIMDYYLQKSITEYSNSHLHLIGITSMFIASKLEDIYQIPLKDFVTRISHYKYSSSNIKAMEQSILETLNFEITFPTSLDYLQNILYQFFSSNDNPILKNIQNTSVYILKMCLHNYQMTSISQNTLASSAFIYSIKDFVLKNNQKNQELIINQFINKTIQIYQINQNEIMECLTEIQDLIQDFQKNYPTLQNLDKYK
ncbi:unnamed protein product [Paramecium pentaurelia]|uniref:Cyclin-like domain-containing protein n=1 Tax=Paramecium pentaurelia TaxID=43138 RepID=A0A8S1WQ36_9CILI|nr:unnamed protein product [Paramecium pentaurelia]